MLCRSSKWLRAPMGGLFRSFKADGELVRKDDRSGLGHRSLRRAGARDTRAVRWDHRRPRGHAGRQRGRRGVSPRRRAVGGRTAEGAMGISAAQLADDPMFDEDEII
jgi:hypothetical protein